jgi:hypothetical protein
MNWDSILLDYSSGLEVPNPPHFTFYVGGSIRNGGSQPEDYTAQEHRKPLKCLMDR